MSNDTRYTSSHAGGADLSDVTTGTPGGVSIFSFTGDDDPVRKASLVISQISDAAVAQQVDRLLATIRTIIKAVRCKRPDVGHIPPLLAQIDEDGAVLIEWIFPDFRVGFNLEKNPDDSGWHFVSGKNLGRMIGSGQLENMDSAIYSLTRLIFENI